MEIGRSPRALAVVATACGGFGGAKIASRIVAAAAAGAAPDRHRTAMAAARRADFSKAMLLEKWRRRTRGDEGRKRDRAAMKTAEPRLQDRREAPEETAFDRRRPNAMRRSGGTKGAVARLAARRSHIGAAIGQAPESRFARDRKPTTRRSAIRLLEADHGEKAAGRPGRRGGRARGGGVLRRSIASRRPKRRPLSASPTRRPNGPPLCARRRAGVTGDRPHWRNAIVTPYPSRN